MCARVSITSNGVRTAYAVISDLKNAADRCGKPAAVRRALATYETKALLALQTPAEHETVARLEDVHGELELREDHGVEHEQRHANLALHLLLFKLFPPSLVPTGKVGGNIIGVELAITHSSGKLRSMIALSATVIG